MYAKFFKLQVSGCKYFSPDSFVHKILKKMLSTPTLFYQKFLLITNNCVINNLYS
jgi:hypothetical protein